MKASKSVTGKRKNRPESAQKTRYHKSKHMKYSEKKAARDLKNLQDVEFFVSGKEKFSVDDLNKMVRSSNYNTFLEFKEEGKIIERREEKGKEFLKVVTKIVDIGIENKSYIIEVNKIYSLYRCKEFDAGELDVGKVRGIKQILVSLSKEKKAKNFKLDRIEVSTTPYITYGELYKLHPSNPPSLLQEIKDKIKECGTEMKKFHVIELSELDESLEWVYLDLFVEYVRYLRLFDIRSTYSELKNLSRLDSNFIDYAVIFGMYNVQSQSFLLLANINDVQTSKKTKIPEKKEEIKKEQLLEPPTQVRSLRSLHTTPVRSKPVMTNVQSARKNENINFDKRNLTKLRKKESLTPVKASESSINFQIIKVEPSESNDQRRKSKRMLTKLRKCTENQNEESISDEAEVPIQMHELNKIIHASHYSENVDCMENPIHMQKEDTTTLIILNSIRIKTQFRTIELFKNRYYYFPPKSSFRFGYVRKIKSVTILLENNQVENINVDCDIFMTKDEIFPKENQKIKKVADKSESEEDLKERLKSEKKAEQIHKKIKTKLEKEGDEFNPLSLVEVNGFSTSPVKLDTFLHNILDIREADIANTLLEAKHQKDSATNSDNKHFNITYIYDMTGKKAHLLKKELGKRQSKKIDNSPKNESKEKIKMKEKDAKALKTPKKEMQERSTSQMNLRHKTPSKDVHMKDVRGKSPPPSKRTIKKKTIFTPSAKQNLSKNSKRENSVKAQPKIKKSKRGLLSSKKQKEEEEEYEISDSNTEDEDKDNEIKSESEESQKNAGNNEEDLQKDNVMTNDDEEKKMNDEKTSIKKDHKKSKTKTLRKTGKGIIHKLREDSNILFDENSSEVPSYFTNEVSCSAAIERDYQMLWFYEEPYSKLQLYSIPDMLPCREKEFAEVKEFLENSIKNKGSSTCLYISGMPGTGKTATVLQVMRKLENKKRRGKIPNFDFIHINGMNLPSPYAVFSQIYYEIFDKKTAPVKAMVFLENFFKKGALALSRDPRNKKIFPKELDKVRILLVDELDRLLTKKQEVLYNLVEWPGFEKSKLIIVGIANTMNLPEEVQSKIGSRLGNKRIVYEPYNKDQIQKILKHRLEHCKLFEEEAIKYASAKVAVTSGDIRRSLQICKRAIEIAKDEYLKKTADLTQEYQYNQRKKIQESHANLIKVSKKHVIWASEELYNSKNSKAINNLSFEESLVLVSIGIEKQMANSETVSLFKAAGRAKACFRKIDAGKPPLDYFDICEIIHKFSKFGLISVEQSKTGSSVDHDINVKFFNDEIINFYRDDNLLSQFLDLLKPAN